MSADQILRRIAERQLNLVTRKQALAAGVSDAELRHRLAVGILATVHAGVYLFGPGRMDFEAKCLAASLACGARSFVSYRSAAFLWRLTEVEPSTIEVTTTSPRRPVGVAVHRTRSCGRNEQTKRGVVPVATVARTLLDLAVISATLELERAADAAFRQRLLTPHRLAVYLRGRARTPGIGALTKIADDRINHGVTDSDFEMDAIRVLRSYGLPEPVRQQRNVADGRRVRYDLTYPGNGVVIELDGEAPHWGRDRWQADHDRHNAVELSGLKRLEFTWWDVHDRPQYFVVTVADALGLRPARWAKKRARGRPQGPI